MPDFKKLPTVNSTAVALAGHVHPVAGLAISPALWFDAAQISGLTDGAAVATWADVSGNSRNATQATGAARPTYKTAILNGYPVVRFDGDDHLATASFAVALAQPVTIIVVHKFTSTAGSPRLVGGNDGNDPVIWVNSGNYALWAGGVVSSSTPIDTNWRTVTAVFNGASSLIRRDGIQIGSGDASTTASSSLRMGADNATSNFFTGDIAEVLVYDQLLTTQALRQTESYLTGKYALKGLSPLDFAALIKWGTD